MEVLIRSVRPAPAGVLVFPFWGAGGAAGAAVARSVDPRGTREPPRPASASGHQLGSPGGGTHQEALRGASGPQGRPGDHRCGSAEPRHRGPPARPPRPPARPLDGLGRRRRTLMMGVPASSRRSGSVRPPGRPADPHASRRVRPATAAFRDQLHHVVLETPVRTVTRLGW